MSLFGFRVLCNSYRAVGFLASNQLKFISNNNAHFRANFSKSYCSDSQPRCGIVDEIKVSDTECSVIESKESITVTFKLPDGTQVKKSGKIGDTLRSTVQFDDPDFKGNDSWVADAWCGACCGGMCCGICHVVLSKEDFQKLDEPGEKEKDVLYEVKNLTPHSRLACAMSLAPEMDGMIVGIPKLY